MATYTVTTLADGYAADGQTTLREAIIYGLLNPGSDQIRFDPSLAGKTIVLGGSQLPVITDEMEIVGPEGGITISGNQQSRILEIAPTGRVDLINLDLRQGAGKGAGIRNAGDVTLDQVTVRESLGRAIDNEGIARISNSDIRDNQLPFIVGEADGQDDDSGGGIVNRGFMEIRNSEIWQNRTSATIVTDFDILGFTDTGSGGGIFNVGRLELFSTRVFANESGTGGGIYSGGSADGTPVPALYIADSEITANRAMSSAGGIYAGGESVVIDRSTIAANSSGEDFLPGNGHGSGIFIVGAVTKIVSSTIRDNATDDAVGAITNQGVLEIINTTMSGQSLAIQNIGRLEMVNSTIVNNGAGLWNDTSRVDQQYVSAVFHNSIFANNSYEIYDGSPNVSGSHNLIRLADHAGGLIDGVDGNLVGVDPRLVRLTQTRGSTETYTLLPDSPAIDAGSASLAPPYDQRGVARPQGSGVDIGAVEMRSPLHVNVLGSDYGEKFVVESSDGITTISIDGAETSYADAEMLSLTISTGGGIDGVTVKSTPPMPFSVFTGAGNDRIDIGDGSVALASALRGPVLLDTGDSDADLIVIDDSSPFGFPGMLLGDANYRLSTEIVGGVERGVASRTGESKFETAFEISFRNAESFRLESDDNNRVSDSEIDIVRTLPGTSYSVRGNRGDDLFRIHAAGLRSNVSISGGQPTTAPGDGLEIIGDGSQVASYLPTGTASGRINLDSQVITFSGLEPVYAESLLGLTLQTPWSRDFLQVEPDDRAGWTKISGTSGVIPATYESLSFRNIPDVLIDAGANDSALQTWPIVAPPNPGDVIEIQAGALNAQGLQTLRVATGIAIDDIVIDRSLEDGGSIGARLAVETTSGLLTYVQYGSGEITEVQLGADRAVTLTCLDESGNVCYRVDGTNVGRLILPDTQASVRVQSESQGVFVSQGSDRQTVTGTGVTSLEYAADDFAKIELLVHGIRDLHLNAPVLGILTVSGSDGEADHLTVYAGESAFEVPDGSGVRPRIGLDYGPEDRITFAGLSASDVSSGIGYHLDPYHRSAMTLEQTFDQRELGWTLQGRVSSLGFVGSDRPDGIVIDPGMLMPTLPGLNSIELLVDVVGIELLRVAASEDATRFVTALAADGSTQTAAGGMPGSGNQLIELLVTTDSALDRFEVHGGNASDQFELTGTDRLAPLRTTVDQIELLRANVGDGRVDHRLTPASGELGSSAFVLTHDDAVTDFDFAASHIKQSITGDFARPLHAKYALTGSVLEAVIEDATFAGPVVLDVSGAPDANHIVQVAEHDVTYTQGRQLQIRSAVDDRIVLSRSGVFTHADSQTDITSGNGVDQIVWLTNGGGNFGGATDTVSVTGESGDKLLAVSSGDLAPLGQLDALLEREPTLASLAATVVDADVIKALRQESEVEPSGSPASFTTDFGQADSNVIVVGRDVQPPELIGTGIILDGPMQTFPVTNTADSGPGSFRAAIEAANAWNGSGTAIISFAIPAEDPGFVDVDATIPGGDAAADVFVIAPQTGLPPITRPNVVINGQSQQNRTGDSNPFGPEIVLSGGELNTYGIELQSESNIVHAMVLQGFLRALIRVDSDSNRITGNYLGTNATGTAKARDIGNSNESDGIYLASASGNVIGGDAAGLGNLISGKRQGIWIVGGSENLIQGNRIGTNADVTDSLDNLRGVLISDSSHNRVIDNQVAGSLEGIGIRGAASTETVVQGNRIGLDASGTVALPLQRYGIRIADAPRTLVGGLRESERNVVSGGWYGVVVQGTLSTETRIQGNYVGTDVTGTHAVGNGTGVWLLSGAANNLVGGSEPGARNLLSGNVQNVVIDGGASDNRVQGNTIGLDVTQSVGITTEGGGVTIAFGASGNIIGTDGDGLFDHLEGNIISGHQFQGVFIWRGATENVVAGNLIGTDPTGTYAIGNNTGVDIQESDQNRIGTNGDGVSDDLERNVISGNRVYGVAILAPPWEGTGADENTVAGNLIGTDITGTVAIGNARAGIGLRYTNAGDGHPRTPPNANRIGGDKASERNVIAASGGDGIEISNATNTRIVNNFIGVDITGQVALPNERNGIHIIADVRSVTIGSDNDPPNLIAYNTGAGIAVNSSSSEVKIRGNSIFSNGGLGIDLGTAGVTPNDEGDADVGANQLVNFPEILTVAVSADGTRVRGRYDGLSEYPATLDFYANAQADPSGHGEGARWIGTFVTDPAGSNDFDVMLDTLLLGERFVTATATVQESTSEFSQAVGFDSTAPQSRIDAKQLPSVASELQFTVAALAVDPEVDGQIVSGVDSVEFWVSVDGGLFQRFATVDEAPFATNFTAQSNHTYSFRSVATDFAGNVEVKKVAAEATLFVPDLDAPISRVEQVDASLPTFRVDYAASDLGGGFLTSIDIIVEIDGGKPQLVATARVKEQTTSTGSVTFQAIADGQPHDYRFYSVAVDGFGNRETRPQGPEQDIVVSIDFDPPAGLDLIGFDVQRGATQRSYLRHIDAVFNTADGLDEILTTLSDADPTNDRVRLTKFDLGGNDGKALNLSSAIVTRNGQGIEIDFGSNGIGGNRNSAAGDGYYQLQFDLDGDGVLETTRSFYRLFGDANGDRRVDTTDLAAIASSYGLKGPGLDGDINGDGVVNVLDRLYASRQIGRMVAGHLAIDD